MKYLTEIILVSILVLLGIAIFSSGTAITQTYGSAGIGVNSTTIDDHQLQHDLNYNIALGVQRDNVRYEAQLSMMNAGVSFDNVTGYILSGNLYYDFGANSRFAPFVGAGLDYFVDLQGVQGLTGPKMDTALVESGDGYGAHFNIGARYDLTEQISINGRVEQTFGQMRFPTITYQDYSSTNFNLAFAYEF